METKLYEAFKMASLPSNPIPFLRELEERCSKDSSFIKTNEGKKLLLVLIMQAYGSLFSINSVGEILRLIEK